MTEEADEELEQVLSNFHAIIKKPYIAEKISDDVMQAEVRLLIKVALNTRHILGGNEVAIADHAKGEFKTDTDLIIEPLQAQKLLAQEYVKAGITEGLQSANELAKQYAKKCAAFFNTRLGEKYRSKS